MRLLLLLCLPTLAVAEAPLAEKYLHSGELALGEQTLVARLDAVPKDDAARFGLGMVRFVRAVERFGQSLYEYGADSSQTDVPFLRLPVPKNPNPATVSSRAVGRVLELLVNDLDRVDRTLADITDANVTLPMHLADIKLDLTRSGKANERLIDLLININGGRFDFLKDNPKFLVKFDRGDVAWLRAYCHLLSAMIEVYLSVDLEDEFPDRVKAVFPKIERTRKERPAADGLKITLSDGPRLGRFRRHMLAVCELNRETWTFIRAETDNDHEWLPNAKQTGVIGLPVQDAQIDGWLGMMAQLEELLKGESLIPGELLTLIGKQAEGKGFNVKKFLDDPPAALDGNKILADGIDEKYLELEANRKKFDVQALMIVNRLFNGPIGVAYMAWFN